MRRALLDTNIVIHREAATVVQPSIGRLFAWLDRLGYEKWIHPATVAEIQQHADERVRRTFATKLESYRVIKAPAPLAPAVEALGRELDATPNDRNDTAILNELYGGRVDILITEDRGIGRKAARLKVAPDVYTIDAFLEKAVAENPELLDYAVLAARRVRFSDVDLQDVFFDSFRSDYPGFDRWFHRKADETAYICHGDSSLVAFLYLKVEDDREVYADISPVFAPKRRLKIGTFKVELNGFKLGERFLKIVFDNAIKQRADEIYVTIFLRSVEQERLAKLLEDFGFRLHGEKLNAYGNERVYVRDMSPQFDAADPKLTFPYIRKSTRVFLVPIWPSYHTDLLPDSILRNEKACEYVDNAPHRNAIRKVYVSRSMNRDLATGDTLVFYRTGGYYESVVTTLGVIEGVHLNIPTEDEFLRLCRKRSVFTDQQLREQWQYKPKWRPFIVDFLYSYSFRKRPNLKELIDNHVIKDIESVPRGFEPITTDKFETILRLSRTDTRFIVN
ncbi:MAG TPA: PIN domain-containing protein [Thermoanaerobaculia bacterium]|nr:PIN domain-containing protein [Thermoanaerobaculia bacterium]